MKRHFQLKTILPLALLLISSCSYRESKFLLVVEKGTNSAGIYSIEGEHIKSFVIDTLPHEMRLSADRKYAYITNNGSLRFTDSVSGGQTISVINLKLLTKEQDIPVAPYKRPHAIDIDPATGYLAVGVENPDKVLLIDPDRKQIIKQYDCHGKTPHIITMSKNAKWLYVSNVQSANLVGINTETDEYFSIPVGNKPQGSALSKDEKVLFVGCNDYISVIDLESRSEIAQIPCGANRMELIEDGNLLIFSSTKYGIGFANTKTFQVICHIDIPYKPFSLHLSEDETKAYVAAEEQDIIYQVDVADMKIIRQFKLKTGTRPDPVMDFSTSAHTTKSGTKKTNPLPDFQKLEIDTSFYKAYQIKSVDLNNDKKPDLIAVSDRLPEVVCYLNPTWEKHVLHSSTSRNIDIAPYDIDNDGDADIVLACRFNSGESEKGGYIYWLENPGKIAGTEWENHFIDSVPTSHRVKWADIHGNGREVLINLPLMGIGSVKPEYDVPLSVYSYQIPTEPETHTWKRQAIDTTLRMAHGLLIYRWDNDLHDDILTASFEGVNLYQFGIEPSNKWKKSNLTKGLKEEGQYPGCSEIAVGCLGNYHELYLATIEPWHGNSLVCYLRDKKGIWQRNVLDSSFNDGHALVCADMNFDGYDEIIAGHRGESYNLYIYQYQPETRNWLRKAVDSGSMSAAGVCVFDANNDGFPDIAACGSLTKNVAIYFGSKAPCP